MSLISFKIIFQCVSWRDKLASSAKKIDLKPKPSVQPLAHRSPCEPHKGLTWGWMGGAWLSLARHFRARCKPGGTDALLSAIYRRGVWKGTNASRTKIRFFFGVRNWMCGVRACENTAKPWELAALHWLPSFIEFIQLLHCVTYHLM